VLRRRLPAEGCGLPLRPRPGPHDPATPQPPRLHLDV